MIPRPIRSLPRPRDRDLAKKSERLGWSAAWTLFLETDGAKAGSTRHETLRTRKPDMKSIHSHGIESRLGISFLCANLLFALSPSAGALAMASKGSTMSTGLAPNGSATSLDLSSDVATSTIIRSTGAIESDVNLFRALLGNPNNNATPGTQASGHREINWDAVPAAVTDIPTFPANFFNSNSPRGLVYGLEGGGLEVSDQSFIDLNPAYAGEFVPFSGHKTFSPVGTNETNVGFFVAGSGVKAAVRGFGVVFVDVDTIGSTKMELFGESGVSLGTLTAPIRTDRRGSSFVGIVFRTPVITRVKITTGDAPLGPGEIDVSQGGSHDLVVMDDFLYGEPTALP
jgi:hypothetical protein